MLRCKDGRLCRSSPPPPLLLLLLLPLLQLQVSHSQPGFSRAGFSLVHQRKLDQRGRRDPICPCVTLNTCEPQSSSHRGTSSHLFSLSLFLRLRPKGLRIKFI